MNWSAKTRTSAWKTVINSNNTKSCFLNRGFTPRYSSTVKAGIKTVVKRRPRGRLFFLTVRVCIWSRVRFASSPYKFGQGFAPLQHCRASWLAKRTDHRSCSCTCMFSEIPCSSRQKPIKCGNTEEKYPNWVKSKQSRPPRPGLGLPQRGCLTLSFWGLSRRISRVTHAGALWFFTKFILSLPKNSARQLWAFAALFVTFDLAF